MLRRQRNNSYRAARRPYYRRNYGFRPTLTLRRPIMGGTRLPANKYARGAEIKALDTTISHTFSTAGAITCLNEIIAGSGFNNRIGRRIEIKSLQCNLKLDPLGSVSMTDGYQPPEYLRILLVYDSQTNGALPSINDILLNYTETGSTVGGAYALLNLNNRDRFTIIRDIKLTSPWIQYDTSGTLAIQSQGTADQKYWKTVIDDYTTKCAGCITQYKADSSPAVIGDIATGALYLVTLNNASSSEGTWQLNGNIRLRFMDK